jgi:dolichol-phosphate mannosyltransferase
VEIHFDGSRPCSSIQPCTTNTPAGKTLGAEAQQLVLMNDQIKIRLAVVVPLANEEKTVDDFLSRVVEHLLPNDRVFCVVDHISKDNTRARVEHLSHRDPRIVMVWAPENRCVVDAYFRGYESALEAGASWILEMDGGMSHQPEEIPRFLKYVEGDFDYVVGCRFMAGGSHTGSFWRRFVSWSGGVLANALLGTRMRDMTSGFEMFSSKAMKLVTTHGVRSRAHFFQTEIKYLLRDWRWVEVPITYRSTSPRVPSGALVESLRLLWQMRREARRQT